MAILWVDSFSSYNSYTNSELQARGYTLHSQAVGIGTGWHRSAGERGAFFDGGVGLSHDVSTSGTIGIAIAANFYYQINPYSTIWAVCDESSAQVCLRHNYYSSRLEVYRGNQNSHVLLGTLPIQNNVWCHVEAKVVIDNSAGSVEIRLNGNPTPALLLTGIDTQATANATVNKVILSGDTAGSAYSRFYGCDYVVWNTSGTSNNNFLGDVRVHYRAPTSPAGDSSNWTRSTGSNNYECVDEIPLSDTDYVESAAVNNRDLYNLTNLTATTGTVKAVQVLGRALKTDAGLRQFALVNKSGTTETTGTTHTLASSAAFYSQLWETNPDTTAAWSLADVNSLQIGVKDVA